MKKAFILFLLVVALLMGTTALADNGDGWGYVDIDGNVVIPGQWDYAQSFYGGMATVFNGTVEATDYLYGNMVGQNVSPCIGKYGIIDVKGNIISPLQWDYVSTYTLGYKTVFSGTVSSLYYYADQGENSYIDIEGNVMPLSKWDDVAYPEEGMNAQLHFYFTNDQVYEARYMLTESHANPALYIDDYDRISTALTKKYGQPSEVTEAWDTLGHQSAYADQKGDALAAGYLTYLTTYTTDRTQISITMHEGNNTINIIVHYASTSISPGEPDYSNEL